MIKGLKDIKGIVDVADNSLFYFGISTVIVILAMAIGAYFLFRKRRKKRRFLRTPEEIAKSHIQNMDFNDPKNVVYTFGEDVKMFVDEKNEAEYKQISEALEPYKYKKEVPSLDEKLKARIKAFIKEVV